MQYWEVFTIIYYRLFLHSFFLSVMGIEEIKEPMRILHYPIYIQFLILIRDHNLKVIVILRIIFYSICVQRSFYIVDETEAYTTSEESHTT